MVISGCLAASTGFGVVVAWSEAFVIAMIGLTVLSSSGPGLFTGFKTASSGREVADPPVLDSESCGTSTNGAPVPTALSLFFLRRRKASMDPEGCFFCFCCFSFLAATRFSPTCLLRLRRHTNHRHTASNTATTTPPTTPPMMGPIDVDFLAAGAGVAVAATLAPLAWSSCSLVSSAKPACWAAVSRVPVPFPEAAVRVAMA